MSGTESTPRSHHVMPNRSFDELEVGEIFRNPSRTLTDAQLLAFQAVSGDNHPIHYDIEYCRAKGHPGLLAHGLQVLSTAAAGAGPLAHVIGEGLIGFLDQSSKFLKPVYAGDTCLLYTSPSPRDLSTSRMPSSA